MKEKQSMIGKLWLKKEIHPYKTRIILLACLTVIATLLSLFFSYLIRFVINNAANGATKRMWIFAAVCAGIAFLRVFFQVFRSYYAEKCRTKITVGLRSHLFFRLLCADYNAVEQYHSGDLLNRLTSDVGEVANASVNILPSLLGMLVQCIGAIIALFLLDPLFTAIFTAGGVVLAVVSVFFRKKAKIYHKRLMEADGKSRSFMQECSASLMTVKAYRAEERTATKAQKLLDDYYVSRMKKNKLNVAIGGSFSLLSVLSMVFAVVWCSVEIVGKGTSDYGSILSVILLLSQLQQPFASFSSILPAIYSRDAAAERLAETDNLPTEEKSGSIEKTQLKKYMSAENLCLDNITFGYANRENIFSNTSARVPMRKITCIQGKSGTGKSTLFKLLLHVYCLHNGNIYFEKDGANENMSVTAATREMFAYVPQGNFLFSGTIYDNLTFFADNKTSDAEIRLALETACATFVYDLPQGLFTVLHERGAGLSEGQLQRLAVARALLSHHPILLLDEATSALDENTEKALLENIQKLKDITCIIVTHRNAALSIADKILTIEDGKILSTDKIQ